MTSRLTPTRIVSGRRVTWLVGRLIGLTCLFVVLGLALLAWAAPQALAASEFVFVGRGAGHGVGMSQWGAWQMARQGYTFDQILAFYYPGTTLQPMGQVPGLNPNPILKVRLSANPPNDNSTTFSRVSVAPSVTEATLLLHTNGAQDQVLTVPLGSRIVLSESGGKVQIGEDSSWTGADGGSIAGTLWDYVELRPLGCNGSAGTDTSGTASDGSAAEGRVSLQVSPVGSTTSYSREYWGVIRVQPGGSSGQLWVYNFVALEKYVRGIAEVDYDWARPSSSTYYAPEAVKAQAVASRTYAVAKQGTLSDNWTDQCYRGYTLEAKYPGIAQAAIDTAGLILTYQGKPITAYFSGHSGGYTNASAWGITYPPYIVAQPDPWSRAAPPENPGLGWTRKISAEALSAKVNGNLKDLSGRTVNIGLIQEVTVASRDTADKTSHARTLRLVGELGSVEVRASSFRSVVGTSTLPSTLILSINGDTGAGSSDGDAPLPLGEFYDVGPTHLYHDQIKRVVEAGLMSGYANGLFRPNDSITRGQFAKIAVCLYNLLHPEAPLTLQNVTVKPFSDVPINSAVLGDVSDWVATAKAAGLVRGISETIFDPDSIIRRDQMASMLCRALGWEDEAAALPKGTPGFADVPFGSGHWAAATYLKQQGILLGYPTTEPTLTVLRVTEPIKRMHVAVILCRVLDLAPR